MNVLSISWTRKTAKKLAWKILNVLSVFQAGIWQVLCPFPCSVFAVYLPGTPPFAPSDTRTFSRRESVASACQGLINSVVTYSCSSRCRTCSVNHDPELNQRFLHLQRRETQARDLQDPERLLQVIPRYPPTLNGTVLSSCQRPRGQKGPCKSVSIICASHI